MIAHLTGTILRRKAGSLVVDVNGVGYLVSVTPEIYSQSNSTSQVSLFISHIIREDAQTLFGFSSDAEQQTFELLCTVSGVGPKSAMSVLAQLGVDGVAQAVATADDSMFKSVSGVGPKTAKLIVLTLTGKLITSGSESTGSSAPAGSVLAALVGLGYPERSAKIAVESALKTNPSALEQELLKLSLGNLAAGRKVSADE